jgi:hypothetical protein
MSLSASLVGWKTSWHFIFPNLISQRMRTFSKPILGVEEYEGVSASALLAFLAFLTRFPSFKSGVAARKEPSDKHKIIKSQKSWIT